MPTMAIAVDDMLSLVKSTWDAGASTTGKTLLWEGKDLDPPTSGTAEWGRAAIVHDGGPGQTRLGPNPGFDREGTLFIQIFAPAGSTLTTARLMADTMLAGFEGVRTANDVWFRDTGINEIGRAESGYEQINVTVRFIYTD